jgi:hypothetical protein
VSLPMCIPTSKIRSCCMRSPALAISTVAQPLTSQGPFAQWGSRDGVQLQAGVGAVDASWLNQVELRFSKLKRDLLGCGNSPAIMLQCFRAVSRRAATQSHRGLRRGFGPAPEGTRIDRKMRPGGAFKRTTDAVKVAVRNRRSETASRRWRRGAAVHASGFLGPMLDLCRCF